MWVEVSGGGWGYCGSGGDGGGGVGGIGATNKTPIVPQTMNCLSYPPVSLTPRQ